MRHRLLIAVALAVVLGAGTGCWRSSDACRSDGDCNGPKKCLQSGGVVFGNGVCVLPCTTERLAEQCRKGGGVCSGNYCVEFGPDADAFSPDGRADAPEICERPDDYQYCQSRGLPCGPENNPVEGRDKCGNQRSVNCNDVIDFGTEEQHCGGCGNECDFSNNDGTDNADGGCREGSCVIDNCYDGYKDLDGDGSNGCECEVTEEVCDGEDNDCDGEVDELDCECTAGEEQLCYTGEEGTVDTGICDEGTRTCQEDGTWGTCSGDTTPADDEDCDDSEDDDCNGTVNDGCPCDYQGQSQGVCADQSIDENGNCSEPADFESQESSCDGKDNDCDGVTDKDLKTTFYGDDDDDGYGVSSSTTEACSNPDQGKWADQDGDCDNTNADVHPGRDEDCSTSFDSDCDGPVNEYCPCDYQGTSTGICDQAMRDGSGNCQEPTDYEDPETSCSDGVDNDCDGQSDADDSDCA